MHIDTCISLDHQLNRNPSPTDCWGPFLSNQKWLRNFGSERMTSRLRLSHPRIWSLVPRSGLSSGAADLWMRHSLRFNTRATKYLAKNGWQAFFHWYDYMSLFAEICVVWRSPVDEAILCHSMAISWYLCAKNASIYTPTCWYKASESARAAYLQHDRSW